MKAKFLLTSRQFVRGGARTWFTWICAVICTGLIGAVLFGGESLAASFSQRSDLAQQVLLLSRLVLGSLILGLAILLRSIFRLSLSQRTRMLGQMASLGATRRQLRQSVWMDALILAGCLSLIHIFTMQGNPEVVAAFVGGLDGGVQVVRVAPVSYTHLLGRHHRPPR